MTSKNFNIQIQQEKVPTATAHEHRLRIFDATRRPTGKANEKLQIVSAHGSIDRIGVLCQTHADVLDSILACAEKSRKMQDGRIKLLIDPARARRTACVSSGSQFSKLVTELMSVVIEIKEPIDFACKGHLVDHIDVACRPDKTPITRHNPLTGGERPMWRVELGKALCKLIDLDTWVSYDPKKVTRLRHGVSQALARHVLSHANQPNGGWKLDGLLLSVGATGEIRNRRREIRADAVELREIGIVVDGNRIRRV